MSDLDTLLSLEAYLQASLELDMKEAGAARCHAMLEKMRGGHESSTGPGRRMVAGTLLVGAQAIRDGIARVQAGNPTRGALAVDFIKDFDPECLALLTARALIDSVASLRPLTATARVLGMAVEDELRLAKFEEVNKGAYQWTMRRVKEDEQRHTQRETIKQLMKYKRVDWASWGQRKAILVGMWLLDQFNGATGLFTVGSARSEDARQGPGYKRHVILEPKPETVAWLREAEDKLELIASQHWPMIAPPRNWRKAWGGGYLTPIVPTQSLVKYRRTGPGVEYFERLKRADLRFVTQAVNTVQRVEWSVNREVLAVLRHVQDNDLFVEGLPTGTDAVFPAHPNNYNKEKDLDAHRRWCKSMSIIHRANKKSLGKRIQVARTLQMAERFSIYDTIYFPHNLDFRGRLYPISSFLHPQGADYQKGLLKFAHGKPIETEEHLEWLAIHGANCYGIDKVSFVDRWNWVVDHQAAVLDVADNPLTSGWDFWTRADSPFQFLAWCKDFAAVLRGGWGTVSSVPVALDGTCNGLQHYSAALRDPIGALATNLTPTDKPQDIYRVVAERVVVELKKLKDTSGPDGEYARQWLEFGIDRKITKRSVMTLPYGCSVYSVREFIEEAIQDKLKTGVRNPWSNIAADGIKRDGLFDASKFLQPYVWSAIGKTVVAARLGMNWLQSVARAAAKVEKPVYWTTADGLPVQQAYANLKMRRIETRFNGKILRPAILEETDVLDRHKQRNGIAPNWVHSMDGTALRMFVRIAAASGVTSMAVIHDSYGALAADIPVVAESLREAFFRLYDGSDELGEFWREVSPTLGREAVAEVPPAPPAGTLDIGLVKESLYFFA